MTLLELTNDPGATEAEHTAKGWIVGCLFVLKFYPSLQPDTGERFLYAIRFWLPAQEELRLV